VFFGAVCDDREGLGGVQFVQTSICNGRIGLAVGPRVFFERSLL